MKKVFLVIILLLLPLSTGAQWDDCIHGEINEPAPGTCGLFADTDSDNICDHSQLPPQDRQIEEIVKRGIVAGQNEDFDEHDIVSGQELKTKTVQEVAVLYGIFAEEYASNLARYLGEPVKPIDNFGDLHDRLGLAPGIAKDIALAIKNGSGQIDVNLEETESGNNNQPVKTGKSSRAYNFFPILAVLLVFYLISKLLVKEAKITMAAHRRVWNVLLLITFLVSGILGIMLIFRIDYGWFAGIQDFMLFWHVEFAIAAAIISVFHISWHWRYFTGLFKLKKN